MIIAISGTAGSGKSTIAKMLAIKLKYKHYSMGDFQREIAKEKKISIEELGELEKKDPAIDRMVDDRQRQLGNENNFVIDSWLSAFFIKNSYKIFMDADLKERAKRILDREPEHYKNLKDAMNKIKKREETNRERWKNFYGYDFKDKKNYHLYIDTSGKSIDAVFKIVYGGVKNAK